MPPAFPTPTGDSSTAEKKPDGATLWSLDDAEEYNSEEDSDFDINAPVEAEDDDEEPAPETEADDHRPRKRRKLTPTPGGDEDGDDYVVDGALDSGDEATIRKAKENKERKRRKRARAGGDDEGDEGAEDDFEIDEDDEGGGGGGGGFVRTRAMKMKMHEEMKPLARTDGATIDVDALWAQMNARDPGSTPIAPKDGTRRDVEMTDTDHPSASSPAVRPSEETITIKRTYKFAGETITEEKLVPKDSAEAKTYLSSMDTPNAKQATAKKDEQQRTDQPSKTHTPPLRRPLRRYSRFDPNPPDMYKRNWVKASSSHIPPTPKEQQHAATTAPSTPVTGPKLNTVMKSKLDWATYVDKEGIKDELDVHSRAKEGYMGRMDFLGRVEAKREEERRNARLKGAGK
ncbi:swr complex subunit [Emydomyces testavorans]|uniref:SWR1-complex protein 5 n=1 Tax=Emydomyces testavorans TaxID=2070801 RepID=A0AAF0DAG9_9EURO|nr:swr complex subunit [Emydomyces testavorans]